MSSSNVVADVRKLATAAAKGGHKLSGVTITPAKWASAAGYDGSAAGPLRKHMARDNGNGCGRRGRYPAVTAAGMLELLDLADKFAAEQEERKRDALRNRIGSKLRPAAATGASQAKTAAKTKAPAKAKATA